MYHFHTRTRTGGALRLNEAAPDVYAQISESDAASLGIEQGSLFEVETRRGKVQTPAGAIRQRRVRENSRPSADAGR